SRGDPNGIKPIELFKLHLADISEYQKPELAYSLDYHKAIKDYLEQMKLLIQNTLLKRWPGIKFSQVWFVFTISAEWKPHAIGVFRDCIYKAEYLEKDCSNNLEFATEHKAI
ncbi:3632_t:CDS:2, partial [Cetraspora pellucida]